MQTWEEVAIATRPAVLHSNAMARVVVYCGVCGFPIGVVGEVDGEPDEEQLRSLVAGHVGEGIRCERCNSVLLGDSGTLGADEPRIERAVASERIRHAMRGGARWAVGRADGRDPSGMPLQRHGSLGASRLGRCSFPLRPTNG